MFICKFCNKTCKSANSLRNHERLCPKNPNRVYINGMTGKTAWNKGLTKDTDSRVAKLATNAIGNPGPTFTKEQKAKFSENAKKNGLGGYRPHPNKGSRYNGIWFDSNWEIIVAKDLDLNNVKWVRPKTGFVWTDTGNKYYPDFFLEDYDIYLDPKNEYLREKDTVKILEAQKRNNIKVIVLAEHQLLWTEIKKLL